MIEEMAEPRAGNPRRAARRVGPSGSIRSASIATVLALAPVALASCASGARIAPGPETAGDAEGTGSRTSPLDNSLAPFVPSPLDVVRRMLEVARVTDDDVVYDLGSGDGRIVVEAAKTHGARAVGIEYDLRLCEEARDRAAREGVGHLVEIRHQDVMESDLSDATVVTLYLLPASNERLKPKLLALRPGTRIVAHNYGIAGWEPLSTAIVETRDYEPHTIMLWEVGR